MSDAKQVIIFPRGQLNAKDKERLNKAGVVAVEADDPSKVICIDPGPRFVTSDDLLMSSLSAVVNSGEGRRFSEALYARLKKREEASQQHGPAADQARQDGRPGKSNG